MASRRAPARVALRELRPDDGLALWSSPDVVGEFNNLGPRDPDLAIEAGAAISRMAVVGAGEGTLVGEVSWRLVRYGPNRESRAWNIGINLLPAARGRGYGREAQRLLAAHLFDTTDVDRVEASTDIDNLAEQRALERAGFTREGVLRGAQFRAGRRHDLVSYAILRSDL